MTQPGGDFVLIGRVLKPFGLRGEVKIATRDSAEFRPGRHVVLRRPHELDVERVVETARVHQGAVLARFAGDTDATAAEKLRAAEVLVARADLSPLPPGTFLAQELIGLRVIDALLGELGPVVEVMHYPASDVLVIGERRAMVPMLRAYGVRVDLASGEITTELPAGFDELL